MTNQQSQSNNIYKNNFIPDNESENSESINNNLIKNWNEFEKKFTWLSDNANVGIFVSDIKGNFFYANKHLLKISGYNSFEEFKKISAIELYVDKNDRDRLLEILMQSGKVEEFETRIYYKGKKVRWVWINAMLQKNEEGKPFILIGFIKDIHDKKLAEIELVKTRNLLKQYFDIVNVVLVGINTDHTINIINNKGSKILGYSESELIGKNWFEIAIPKNQINILKEYFNKLIESKDNDYKYHENEIITKDGDIKLISWYTTKVYDHEGNLTGFLSSGEDITEQRKIEKQLKESELRWQFALEEAGDGVWDWNIQNNTIYYSLRYKKVLGYDENEFSNAIEEWEKHVHPEDKENSINELYKYINGEIPEYKCEYRIKCKNGNYKWIIDRAKIVNYSDSGKPLRCIGIHLDITHIKMAEEAVIKQNIEYKKLNEEYLKLNNELKQKLVEIERINEELKIAKEKSEESERLKSSFIANMSHEIRTPLNGLIGFSTLLANENVTPEKRRYYANIVEDTGQQLSEIINDILDFSAIESGQIKAKPQIFHLNEIIEELFSFYSVIAIKNNINLNYHIALSENNDIIETDKTKLKQILNNLLSNAFKYTKQGYIEFGYQIKEKMIELYVKDTGIGIDKKYHKIIFDRFRQVDNNETIKNRGTGLGLAICKAYTELLGGKIWLISEENKGSEFYFNIPYNKAEIAEK
jgi:PAS domain S-box-containing protein